MVACRGVGGVTKGWVGHRGWWGGREWGFVKCFRWDCALRHGFSKLRKYWLGESNFWVKAGRGGWAAREAVAAELGWAMVWYGACGWGGYGIENRRRSGRMMREVLAAYAWS